MFLQAFSDDGIHSSGITVDGRRRVVDLGQISRVVCKAVKLTFDAGNSSFRGAIGGSRVVLLLPGSQNPTGELR